MERKGKTKVAVEKGPAMQIGAVMIPMAQLLKDDAVGVLRGGGAVESFASWDPGAETSEDSGSGGGAAAAAAAGDGATRRECFSRLP